MRRWMILPSIVFLSVVLSVIPARGAGSFTFTTIDGPGAIIDANAIGVNTAGQIVGWYTVGTPTTGYNIYGFLRDAQGRYTSLNYPGAKATYANGINNVGEIVGTYWLESNTTNTGARGFKLAQGMYTPIDVGTSRGTEALGINDLGQIVGYYNTTNETRGFLLAAGSFSPIDYRDATFAASYTVATGINKAGQIVGWYKDRTYKIRGFLLAQGRYTSINYPGAVGTAAYGINNVGQIVGLYVEENKTTQTLKIHGFLGDAQGRYTSIDYPGANHTYGYGINSPDPKGRYSIVGKYTGADGTVGNIEHGFLATPCGRLCIPLF